MQSRGSPFLDDNVLAFVERSNENLLKFHQANAEDSADMLKCEQDAADIIQAQVKEKQDEFDENKAELDALEVRFKKEEEESVAQISDVLDQSVGLEKELLEIKDKYQEHHQLLRGIEETPEAQPMTLNPMRLLSGRMNAPRISRRRARPYLVLFRQLFVPKQKTWRRTRGSG